MKTKNPFNTEDLEKEIARNQRKRDKEDLKNELNPIYDIQKSVHENSFKELLELHEAIAVISSKETSQRLKAEIEKSFERLEKKSRSMGLENGKNIMGIDREQFLKEKSKLGI